MTVTAWGGDFPKDWRTVRLKNLTASVTSGVWGDEPSDDNGVVCVRAADFDREHLQVSLTKAPLRSIPLQQLQSCELTPGDLILEKSGGGDQHPVGAVVMFDHPVRAVPTNFAARIRPAPNVDARFLCYILAAAYVSRLNVRSIKQTTGLQNLDVGSFLAEGWAVPSLTDQVRIAGFLDRETARIDGLIERKRQLLSLVGLRRGAVLSNAVLGRLSDKELVDTDDKVLPQLPLGWLLVRLRHVAEEITVGVVVTPAALYAEEGLPFIRGFNVRPGDVSRTDLARIGPEANAMHPKSVLRPGDVLVVRTGQAGAAALVPDWAVGGNCVDTLIVRCGDSLRPKFLERFLNSQPATRQIESLSVGAIQSHFNVGALQDLALPLPALEEQDRVIEGIEREDTKLRALVDALTSQVELLAERRRALITRAVTGELRA